MSENKKVFFGVDASSVEIKKLLNKEFLELSLKAISDEKPNRNNTWFTPESLENCKDSCYNKPILGFFKNNDFVSHNGKWSKDEELDQEYWDTLGEGERCIGLIRESDNVEIIEDDKGLHWLTFSCAIWTQYSYKQVKRLLKDAIKAKKDGGVTKNISVEVDLTDYVEIYDPVSGKNIIQINSFELVGVTILGSRNGIKVEPGIEGAELSVVDIMNNEMYDKQVTSLRLAYEKLGDTNSNITKEDFSMENNLEQSGTVETPVVTEQSSGTEPTSVVDENVSNGEVQTAGQVDPINTQDPVNNVQFSETNPANNEEAPISQNYSVDPIYDLTYLTSRAHDFDKDLDWTINFYNNNGVIGGDYVVALLKKHKAMFKIIAAESAAAMVKILEENFTVSAEEITALETACDHCDCVELYSQFEAKEAEYNTLVEKNNAMKLEFEACETKVKELEDSMHDYEDLKNKVYAYEQAELLATAHNFVEQAELSEEQATEIYEGCKSGKYSAVEEIKTAVAIMAFEAKPKNKVKTMYQAPVSNTPIINTQGDPETPKAINSWDVLNNYTGSKK